MTHNILTLLYFNFFITASLYIVSYLPRLCDIMDADISEPKAILSYANKYCYSENFYAQ